MSDFVDWRPWEHSPDFWRTDVNPFSWSVDVWTAIGSVGTALGFVAAAIALSFQIVDRRRRDAESVTAWVLDQYVRAGAGLRREARLHVSNVGSRPVFDVQITVGHGYVAHQTKRIGSLGSPTIPALPPGSQRDWPIEDHLAGVVVEGDLRAEVAFQDPEGRRWIRGFRGDLSRTRLLKASELRGSSDPSLAFEQMGEPSRENPISIAAAFWNALAIDDEAERYEVLSSLCTPESLPAWGNFDGVAEMLAGHGLAAFPSYPAPGIAEVKFPEAISELSVAEGPTVVMAQIMTLQHRTDIEPRGWRVFAVGGRIPPDQIPPAPN